MAAWFVGYTPQLSAAVGIYSGDNQRFYVPGWGTLSGGTLPATVWRTFMQKALADKPVEDFPSPSFGGSAQNWAPSRSRARLRTPRRTRAPNQDGLNPAPEPEVPQPAPETVVPEPVVPQPVKPEPVVPQPGEARDPGFPEGRLPPVRLIRGGGRLDSGAAPPFHVRSAARRDRLPRGATIGWSQHPSALCSAALGIRVKTWEPGVAPHKASTARMTAAVVHVLRSTGHRTSSTNW